MGSVKWNFTPETMALWRKDVEDSLGFPLRIPEYDHIGRSDEEYLSPLWFFHCRFYSREEKLLCSLRHSDENTPFTNEPWGIPGIPETFGTDEDWIARYAHVSPAPPFKGFPWNFRLVYYDAQERPVTELFVRRTFENDSVPSIHMAWHLTCRVYEAEETPVEKRTFHSFDWKIPLVKAEETPEG